MDQYSSQHSLHPTGGNTRKTNYSRRRSCRDTLCEIRCSGAEQQTSGTPSSRTGPASSGGLRLFLPAALAAKAGNQLAAMNGKGVALHRPPFMVSVATKRLVRFLWFFKPQDICHPPSAHRFGAIDRLLPRFQPSAPLTLRHSGRKTLFDPPHLGQRLGIFPNTNAQTR